jgi:hypothetical protein
MPDEFQVTSLHLDEAANTGVCVGISKEQEEEQVEADHTEASVGVRAG